jgi:hypothetical protein
MVRACSNAVSEMVLGISYLLGSRKMIQGTKTGMNAFRA